MTLHRLQILSNGHADLEDQDESLQKDNCHRTYGAHVFVSK